MKIAGSNLTASQAFFIVLLAAPPLVAVLFDIGPGRWINALQDRVLNGHSLEVSVLGVLGLEFFCLYIVAVIVRWITGRTLVQLFGTIVQLFTKSERDN